MQCSEHRIASRVKSPSFGMSAYHYSGLIPTYPLLLVVEDTVVAFGGGGIFRGVGVGGGGIRTVEREGSRAEVFLIHL